jgi:hypothetical protein
MTVKSTYDYVMYIFTYRTAPISVEPELYCFEDYVPKESVKHVSPSVGSHIISDVAPSYSSSQEKENYFFSHVYDR